MSLSPTELRRVLVRQAGDRLAWRPCVVGGEPVANAWEALLGGPGDGVLFGLSHMPSHYRRGPWRLLVEVLGGPRHHAWGCLDAADQPQRYYHDLSHALGEAEALAAVLLADRLRHGPLTSDTPATE